MKKPCDLANPLHQSAELSIPWALAPELIGLCRRAGAAILDIYQDSQMAVEEKSDASPVTQADIAAHQVILNGLQALTPAWPVLSEEGVIPPFAERQQWSTYWLVDPLDGTREFIARNGEFTVNIALIHAGEAVLGVIYVPVTGVVYWGAKGRGAFKRTADGDDCPIQARRLDERLAASQPVDVVASRRQGSVAQEQLLNGLERQLGPIARTTIGSSLKFCLLAEGLADFYPRLGPTSEWDTAAAQGILAAAGGQVVDAQFKPLRYNQKESLLNPYFYALADAAADWPRLLRDSQ